MANWLHDVLSGRPGAEGELVACYSRRLLELARRQLPLRVRQRVDPEDVVQSVYRSFFRRLNDGCFTFEESNDVWRLLATMTYHKARNAIKYHQRERRDVRREQSLPEPAEPAVPEAASAEHLEILFGHLERLLSHLTETQREVVVRRLEGDSIEQIAARVQRSRRTVLRVLAHIQDLAAGVLGEDAS